MRKLITSVISLLMTIIVSISCLFAWYTSNKEVSASGIIASTMGEDYEFNFYIYNNNSWSKITNRISFGELTPGDVIYFKLEAKKLTDNIKAFEAYFADLSSKLNESSFNVLNNKIYLSTSVFSNTIYLYDLVDNRVVIDNKVLYEYSNNQLVLADYKVEDVIYYYNASPGGEINANNKITKLDCTNIAKGESKDLFIALEYNEEASLVSGHGSNLYAYQKLSISKLKINLI